MDRRKFIASSLLSLPVFSTAYALSKKKTLFKGKVIIIGAGAAGLYAGYILKQSGVDFQILEASNRHGGRLGKLDSFTDFPIDLGAQWLHGKRSLLGKLIKSAQTTIVKDESELFYWFKNEMVEKLPRDIISAVSADETLPDISYLEYASRKGFGEEYKYIIEQIAGDQGADASMLSVKWNAIEEYNWSSGNADYKFEQTFFDLIDKTIAIDVLDKIKLNTAVTKIDYSSDSIILTDKSNKQYHGDKVIVTAPITILQDGDIEFYPQLPKQKIDAFNKIGMGAGMKVFMKFKEKFYHENIIGGKVCAAYADELIGKRGKEHVLLAFVMGSQAEYLTNLEDDELIVKTLLGELDEMYAGVASKLFMTAHVENWTVNPFIRGAYSYSKVGIGNARSVAEAPISKKVFFAGEAMCLSGHHQTVHGAMESALLQVERILSKN